MNYLSFEKQKNYYFNRPILTIPKFQVGGKACWRARNLRNDSSWKMSLNSKQVAELLKQVDYIVSKNIAIQDIKPQDLDMPSFLTEVESWKNQLTIGLGVILIRGFPIDQWETTESEIATWCMGLMLGVPGGQNLSDDLLGHVTKNQSLGVERNTRLYKTNQHISYHCDYADVVGLMCLSQATTGGASRIASSVSVHDKILETNYSLLEQLYKTIWLDTRDESDEPAVSVLPCSYDGRFVRTFYHSDYMRSVNRHGGKYQLDEVTKQLLDTYDDIATDPEFGFDMHLEPGDFQLLSNHFAIHSRTSYEDHPNRPRHLLRLWLSMRQ